MRYIILALVTALPFASAQSIASTIVSGPIAASASASPIGAVIPVGGNCVVGGTPCAQGSQCYATNSGLQTRCGNFQAACTSDQQCAFNTCNLQQGLCNGFLSSSTASVSSTVTQTITSASSTITAPAGSLPLGAECNPFANPSQCTAGVQCWASNSGLIPRCGNFNAVCSSNAQCAYNTCNNGLCNGLLPSSSGNATLSVQPSRTPTRSATTTTSVPQFTGSASILKVADGAMAIVLGSIAWVL